MTILVTINGSHTWETITVLYYAAIVLAILPSTLYHVFIKLTPQGVHPAVSLICHL